ncbi:hypothetical protein OROGR_024291 [Orobanche gracilis]
MKMEGMSCMNGMCASSNSLEWRKGWPLRSGGFATLCEDCGTAYQQLTFCEMFHLQETGWRECTSCGKPLHCGCIASSSLLDLLDTGGINCKGCTTYSSKLPSTPSGERRKACAPSMKNGIKSSFEKMVPSQSDNGDEKDFADSGGIEYISLSSCNQSSIGGPSKYDDPLQENRSAKSEHTSVSVPTDLSIGLSASSNQNTLSGCVNVGERQSAIGISSFHRGYIPPPYLLPRLQSPILAAGLQTNSSSVPQLRVARPLVEGRIKNQLLPRYWPRMTDQELQQISGVLSASDAGRIGRMVLPKACAEAYFPPISLPEGLPLRIQDVKGKEWVFQFRFWPNNNSRMYVLEGVTSCIQSMQLQAGDTVTFSRMDPGGRLLMGFRKASDAATSVVHKDSHYATHSGAFQGEQNAENRPLMSGYCGFLHSLKGSRYSYLGNASQLVRGDDPAAPQLPQRKRRNIGPKSKRLVIDDRDSMELTLSWEEVQDMLRPPPTVKPSTVSIEDQEFEEFEEPPVVGKRSIFIARISGEQEQWTQCDHCFQWRKMPIDFLLPSKWTCHDNIYDQTRYSCSAPDELSSRELENLLKMNKDLTKMRVATSLRRADENKFSDPKTHTTVAPTGVDLREQGVAATTKHPRHRPGCSCIVCIQPPSGTGRHNPTCICNVCMTVRRRFNTLMMRKKKRQSEREAEIAHRNQIVSAAAKEGTGFDRRPESEKRLRCRNQTQSQEDAKIFKGGLLDLNSCPAQETPASPRVSMMSLLQEASLPLETYLRQNGLTSLVSDQQLPGPVENIAQAQEEHGIADVIQGHELQSLL